jgi:trehalose 6-phosphate phosphatase
MPLSTGVQQALGRSLRALQTRPCALITDIDGTLSRIVLRPEDATVDPAAALALQDLALALDLVAVITARDEATARRMVGAPALTYVGNYGHVAGTRVGGERALRLALDRTPLLLVDLPCVQVEDKGLGFALHYRNCEDPAAVRERLLGIAGPVAAAADARILEGKKVIELVPRSLPDKAAAFRHLVESGGIKGLIYLGDDISDVAVFREVASLREQGAVNGLSIAVADGETDPSVIEAADLTLASVDEVAALLTALARRRGTQ